MLSDRIFNLFGSSQKIKDIKTSSRKATVSFSKSNIASANIKLFLNEKKKMKTSAKKETVHTFSNNLFGKIKVLALVII